MRIELKNFKCHVSAVFDIPEVGLVALSGASGAGKTTILSAIAYALYGKIPGKAKKPYTHGKSTCKVALTYESYDLHIIRTSRPNRLLVTQRSQEYEDDAAQSIIERSIGMCFDEFMAATYIVQRSNASILSLTPTDQVRFVEILAGARAESFKADVKARMVETKAEAQRIKGELELLESQIAEREGALPEEPETPQAITDGIEPDVIREELDRLTAKQHTIQQSMDSVRKKLESSRTDERRRKEVEAKIERLTTECNQLEKMRGALPPEPKGRVVADSKKEIAAISARLEVLRGYEGYLKECVRVESAVAEYREKAQIRLEEIEDAALDDGALEALEQTAMEAENAKIEYDERRAAIEYSTKRREVARKELTSLFREIKGTLTPPDNAKTVTKMKAYLLATKSSTERDLHTTELALRNATRKRYVCPCCSANLALDDDSLVENDVDTNTKKVASAKLVASQRAKIASLRETIEKIDLWLKRVTEIGEVFSTKPALLEDEPPNPVEIHKTIMRARILREEYDALVNETLPDVLGRMVAKLGEMHTQYEDFDCGDDNVDDLTKDIEGRRRALEKLLRCRADHISYTKEIDVKKAQISILTASLPPRTTTSAKLEREMDTLTQRLVTVGREIDAKRDILDSLTEYESYMGMVAYIEELKTSLEDAVARAENIDQRLEGLHGLTEAGKEAEILALEETIRSINEHAKIYLSQMFENPISVRLEHVAMKGKGSKKALKLQLNTVIEYKGDTYDDIEELCGGERQRCDIAFLLAVNDMIGGGILMLDECLNNLDGSIDTEVLSLIRETCNNKLILVISHQAIRGVFDEEVILEGGG